MSGKAHSAALGVVSLVLIVAGVLFGGYNNAGLDVASLLVLGTAALMLDLASNTLNQTGFICLGFVAAFFTLARPAELTGGQQLDFMAALGQAVVVAGIGMLTRLASLGQGWTHVFSYFGLNLVRLVLVGLPYLLLRGPSTGSPLKLLGIAVATVVFYFYEITVTSWVAAEVHEPANARIWKSMKSKAAPLLALQVPLAALGVGFATSLAAVWPPQYAILAGIALAAVLTQPLRVALHSAADELIVQDQEQLELQINRLKHDTKSLKEERDSLDDELKGKSLELNSIHEMARELGASTNLPDTLKVVKRMIDRYRIPYQSCVIFLAKGGGQLYQALAETPYKEVLEMSPLLQLQEQLITQVMQDGRPQMVAEMTGGGEQRIFKDEKSVLCVPLTVGKEIVGVIYIGSTKAGMHREEHLEKLKLLALYAAPSIKTAQLFETKEQDLRHESKKREEVEAQKMLLEGLQRMGQEIGKTLKIDRTMQIVIENLQQMIGAKAQSVIVFSLHHDDDNLLEAEKAVSPYADFVKTLPIRKDEGLLGKALELKSTLLVKDTNVYDLQNLIAYERSVIVAPLVAEEEVMGCIYVGSTKENSFSEEHRSLVETVSYQAAIAIKNAKLYEQTQQMALTDGLTGLFTHRNFQSRLSEELEWSERSGKPIVLVMVDTDHFKSFNDTLGHPAGDALLKEIASLLKDKVRSTDIVCRYGGDEFALILKDAPKDQAVMTCERIRESFQLRFAAAAVQVTASIGFACFPSDARNKKDLAKAADDAMYVSKRNGRNKVTPAPTLEEVARMKERGEYQEVVQEVMPR